MKTTIKSTAAAVVGMLFAVGHALANPVCEPPGTFYTTGDGTLYDHGCHAFATHDLSPSQARQLWNAGHCSMWNPASGGEELVEVEVETEVEVPDGYTISWVGIGNGNHGLTKGWQVSQTYTTVVETSTEVVTVERPENGFAQYAPGLPLCDEAQVIRQ
jgi:hypothetical protein